MAWHPGQQHVPQSLVHREPVEGGGIEVAGGAVVKGVGADVVAGAAEVVAGGADAELKMSTTLEGLVAAQGVRLVHAISKPTSAHSSIRFPNAHNKIRKDEEINMATRTIATSEDRDSDIRQ
jgi:hypothetical protein